MFRKIAAAVLLILADGFIALSASPLEPSGLTCEHIISPLGIDIAYPVLSWKFHASENGQYQSAYELIVSDNRGDVEEYKGNVWGTGKIQSDENINIEYKGAPLRSFTRYYWRVKVYNQDNVASAWSDVAWFETAMLNPADWQASWIGDGSIQPGKDEDHYKRDRMPLFRKAFSTPKKISSARLYISGAGYYEAHINGNKIGDHVLDPGWTTYKKQILYVTHDITPHVLTGKNIAGIMLGNGWWNPLPFKLFGKWDLRDYQQTGRPCVKAEIHIAFADGTKEVIPTDETWMTAPGPVVKNNIYLGEHYDARLEQKNWNRTGTTGNDWKSAAVCKGPDGILTSQLQPAVKVTKIVKPVSIIPQGKDTFIIDMGQNFAGVVRLRVKGERGRRISLRMGEGLFKNERINLLTAAATQIKKGGIKGGAGAPETAWQEDSYTLKGEGLETWAPRFTFHGFRYIEVTGWPGKPALNDFEGLRMNSDLPPNGSFSCSNEMFNKLHDVIQWTFLSNVFSVQSDCPAREKMGYGADMVVTANAFIYNYNMRNFYRKAIRDFANDQQPDGAITEIAPFTGIADRGYGGNSGPLGWQLAFAFLQKQLYDFYGDKKVIEEYYDEFSRQMEFLQSHAINGLYHWDISDHEALDPKPEAFSASVFYYHHAMLAKEFADILGKPEDSAKYANLASAIRREIISRYFIKDAGRFDNGTQSAQVLGLWYKLSPGDEQIILKQLINEFERHKMHVSSGIFGVKMMFDVLREHEKNDVAYEVAGQRDFPGWGYMLENDATTLWESWAFPETVHSRNHPMFGSIDEWFYRSLAGINPGSAGFKKIIIKPQSAGDLTWAKGSYESVRGTITSEWKIIENKFHLDVSIPANTTGEIWIPAIRRGHILVEGRSISESKNFKWITATGDFEVYELMPGKYSILSDLSR